MSPSLFIDPSLTLRETYFDRLCTLVSGLSLSSVQITPEASIFGGWSGWSIELSFE